MCYFYEYEKFKDPVISEINISPRGSAPVANVKKDGSHKGGSENFFGGTTESAEWGSQNKFLDALVGIGFFRIFLYPAGGDIKKKLFQYQTKS